MRFYMDAAELMPDKARLEELQKKIGKASAEFVVKHFANTPGAQGKPIGPNAAMDICLNAKPEYYSEIKFGKVDDFESDETKQAKMAAVCLVAETQTPQSVFGLKAIEQYTSLSLTAAMNQYHSAVVGLLNGTEEISEPPARHSSVFGSILKQQAAGMVGMPPGGMRGTKAGKRSPGTRMEAADKFGKRVAELQLQKK